MCIGKQGALTLNIWHISIMDRVIGYSCVYTTVVAREYSVLLTRFNTCPPYFKVESKNYTSLRSSMLDVLRYS